MPLLLPPVQQELYRFQ